MSEDEGEFEKQLEKNNFMKNFTNQEPTRECKNCKWDGGKFDLENGDIIKVDDDGSCSNCGRNPIKPPVEIKGDKIEECYSCGGKGYYTQMYGEVGSDDFGGDGYEIAPTIHKKTCSVCKGTGKKPKQELSPELSWGEKYCEEFGLCKEGEKCQCKKELAFIKKVEQQAFNSGRASVIEEEQNKCKKLLNSGKSMYLLGIKEGRASMVEEIRQMVDTFISSCQLEHQPHICSENLEKFLQALKNKETKE